MRVCIKSSVIIVKRKIKSEMSEEIYVVFYTVTSNFVPCDFPFISFENKFIIYA